MRLIAVSMILFHVFSPTQVSGCEFCYKSVGTFSTLMNHDSYILHGILIFSKYVILESKQSDQCKPIHMFCNKATS